MIKIKKTKGGAPFWRHYINIGVGDCEVGCLFCYNRRWDWSKKEWRCYDLEQSKTEQRFSSFQWEPGKCKQYEGPHDIIMCSVGDPFAEMNRNITSFILDLAAKNPQVGDHLRVLSKLDGSCEVRGISSRIPSRNTMFGASVCTLDETIKKITMPNSADLMDVFGGYLYAATYEHNPTFISCEPMLKGMDLSKLMEQLNENEVEELDELWVGRLNYGFGCEEYAMPDNEIIKQVELLVDSYDVKVYVKREVKGSEKLRADGLVMRQGLVYEEKEIIKK